MCKSAEHAVPRQHARAVGAIPETSYTGWHPRPMSWSDAALGGGFALAGVALQQAFSARSERLRYRRDASVRLVHEQHQAFVEMIKSARRVQRALVDREDAPLDPAPLAALALEVDRLTESVAAIRLIVGDEDLVAAVERFEEHAKGLELAGPGSEQQPLRLTPLIEVLRQYEAASFRG